LSDVKVLLPPIAPKGQRDVSPGQRPGKDFLLFVSPNGATRSVLLSSLNAYFLYHACLSRRPFGAFFPFFPISQGVALG